MLDLRCLGFLLSPLLISRASVLVSDAVYMQFGLPLFYGVAILCVLFSRTLMVVLLRMVIFTLLSLRFCQAQSCLDI